MLQHGNFGKHRDSPVFIDLRFFYFNTEVKTLHFEINIEVKQDITFICKDLILMILRAQIFPEVLCSAIFTVELIPHPSLSPTS